MFTVKIREKANRTAKPLRLLFIISIAALALIMGVATPESRAGSEAIPFDEAEVFFEFNSTDLDLGFDIFVDGEPWTSVRVIGPDSRIFRLLTDGSLSDLGQNVVSGANRHAAGSRGRIDGQDIHPRRASGLGRPGLGTPPGFGGGFAPRRRLLARFRLEGHRQDLVHVPDRHKL